jgi:localization factor PodJL
VVEPTPGTAPPLLAPEAAAGPDIVGEPADAPAAPARTVAAASPSKAAPRVATRTARPAAEPTPEPQPQVAAAPLVPPAQVATPQPPVRALNGAAVRQIETGDNTGVTALRQAANLGYAPAQFYLGKLYETGGGGLSKNATEARRWTERAAQSGDPKAMHNLALYFFEGEGGPKNATMAANWFRRAAELGLQDSQYNLARLNEQGFGVPQNAAEAYKWYLIAASNGDADARAGAERTKRMLSPDAQAAAERSAAALRAQITGASRAVQSVAQQGQ